MHPPAVLQKTHAVLQSVPFADPHSRLATRTELGPSLAQYIGKRRKKNRPHWRRLVDTVAMVLNVQGKNVLKNSMNIHLQLLDSSIAMEEEWPSLETPT